MATIIHHSNLSTTETVSANAAGNSTTTRYVIGPPSGLNPYGTHAQGRYELQGTTTWRWVCDEPLDVNTSAPSGYTADNV